VRRRRKRGRRKLSAKLKPKPEPVPSPSAKLKLKLAPLPKLNAKLKLKPALVRKPDLPSLRLYLRLKLAAPNPSSQVTSMDLARTKKDRRFIRPMLNLGGER
jgi:hypothetical protein